ncbi:LADA_0E05534g1_1 [Lachancea dasiensis]|uniref:LADA_0E05534g1_1 n=1 Tax=Lachancea dasiensis TaxID=1072105 RepID=A0A1G4JC40_9SACH|nr:LADA_0E05534g1_1 [Lachancea dasiensis]
MGTKGLEMVIWNKLQLLEKGRMASELPKVPASGFDYEKQDLSQPRPKRTGAIQGLIKWTLVLVLLLVCTGKQVWFVNRAHFADNAEAGTIQESFEITMEKLPETPPVFSHDLLEASFGDSWGKPYTTSFEPYHDGEYDSIILELTTNVSGRQFDRLVHIFIGDINVWRSSTVEPWGNKTIVSQAIKDITPYKTLFGSDKLNVTLQLDNLITNKLTGIFNVKLTAHYYRNENRATTDNSLRGKLLELFTTPADAITPLVTRFSRTPLFYYPLSSKENPRWARGLPEIELNPNISKAVVEIFASGNAAEEFWYTNVLDRYVSRFRKSGHELLGHGPFRAIKVYLTNSEKEILVDTIVPTPVIFTGFFPPLWRPCVGMNAFNIKSYKVDLTPFLSLFESETMELQMEVVSSLDPTFNQIVGENWIISGNLLLWNDKKLLTSSKFLNSTALPNTFDVEVDDKQLDQLEQSVIAKEGVKIESVLTLDEVEYDCRAITESFFSSNQLYLENGDVEQAAVDLLTRRTFTVSKEGVDLYKYVDETGWRFDSRMLTALGGTSPELTYSASITRELDRYVGLQDMMAKENATETLLQLNGVQTGSANYTLSPAGNYGYGDSIHTVQLHHTWPFNHRSGRTVIVERNEVIQDISDKDR